MSNAHRYPGLPMLLGGQELVIPPISAAAARRYWPRIEAMQEGRESNPLALVAELLTACLQRNDPSVTADQVSEWVDVDNMDEVSAKCFGAGSFRRWVAQQASATAGAAGPVAGNAMAPQPSAAAGTGAPSTPPSPPAPVGGGETLTP